MYYYILQDLNDIQLSDEEINVLLKKQNEVISTLEQLELRLSKLDTTFPNVKENCVPTIEKLSNSSSRCHAVNKKYKEKSEPKKLDNNSVFHLVKVRFLLLILLIYHDFLIYTAILQVQKS